jgi:hypothetical protein
MNEHFDASEAPATYALTSGCAFWCAFAVGRLTSVPSSLRQSFVNYFFRSFATLYRFGACWRRIHPATGSPRPCSADNRMNGPGVQAGCGGTLLY